jgi:hypothetical protein
LGLPLKGNSWPSTRWQAQQCAGLQADAQWAFGTFLTMNDEAALIVFWDKMATWWTSI